MDDLLWFEIFLFAVSLAMAMCCDLQVDVNGEEVFMVNKVMLLHLLIYWFVSQWTKLDLYLLQPFEWNHYWYSLFGALFQLFEFNKFHIHCPLYRSLFILIFCIEGTEVSYAVTFIFFYMAIWFAPPISAEGGTFM